MTKVFQEAVEVEQRLTELGLKEEFLRYAVLRGEAERDSCTTNDPPAMGAMAAWGKTVRGLADITAPHGWRRVDEVGLALLVNEPGTIAIAVNTGDEFTGIPEEEPRSKNRKGPVTVAAVIENRRQLTLFSLFDSNVVALPAEQEKPDRMTWILLRSRSHNVVRCELSLPISMGDDGRIEGWRERIVLAPINIDPEPGLLQPEPTPEITIEIARRS